MPDDQVSHLGPTEPGRSIYPWELDDDSTLVPVSDTSQSPLRGPFSPDDAEVLIEHDSSRPEPWAERGWVEVGGQIMSYSTVRKVRIAPLSIRSAEGVPLSFAAPSQLGGASIVKDGLPETVTGSRGPCTVLMRVWTPVGRAEMRISGSGRGGHGAVVWTDRPDLFESDLCSVTLDPPEVFAAPILAGCVAEEVLWAEEPSIDEMPVGTVPPSERIIALGGLRRMGPTVGNVPSDVVLGDPSARSLARGMIFAAHHNSLAEAVAALQLLVGVDGSSDPNALDLRLREPSRSIDPCSRADPSVPEMYLLGGSDTDLIVVVGEGADDVELSVGDGTKLRSSEMEPFSLGIPGLRAFKASRCRTALRTEPSVSASTSGGVSVSLSIGSSDTADGARAGSTTEFPDIPALIVPDELALIGSQAASSVLTGFVAGTGSTSADLFTPPGEVVELGPGSSSASANVSLGDFGEAFKEFSVAVGGLVKAVEGLPSEIAISGIPPEIVSRTDVDVKWDFGRGNEQMYPCYAMIPCDMSTPS